MDDIGHIFLNRLCSVHSDDWTTHLLQPVRDEVILSGIDHLKEGFFLIVL